MDKPLAAGIPQLPAAQLRPLTEAYDRSVRAGRLRLLVGAIVLAFAIAVAGSVAEVRPATFAANLDRFPDYIMRLFHLDTGALVFSDPAEWFWGWRKWAAKLLETLLMAYLGTALGAVGAFALCFLAARNVAMSAWSRVLARRFLEFCRTVPEIVFALIFVVAFGLGPLPGVLAIAIHTLGALGKLFAEVVENADMKPVEGVTAAGAGWLETMRFAVVPQVLSNFASYTLLRFEINVRGAAVMGFVGAGGIGQDLLEAIRKFYYSDVSAILVGIVLTVFLIDMVTERIRHRLLGGEPRR